MIRFLRGRVAASKTSPAEAGKARRASAALVGAVTSLALLLSVAAPASVMLPRAAMAEDAANNQDNVGQYGSDRAYWRHKEQTQPGTSSGRSYNRGYRGDYDRHNRRYYYRDRDRGGNIGAGVAGAIIGLGAGAIIGNSLSRPQRVAPRAGGRYEPWTRDWYRYCSRKYRSFNPKTGYFVTYSGQYRFCR